MITVSFPRTDSGVLAWSQNFLNLITASPTSYNLVAADATSYGVVHTAYQTALANAAPDNRSKPSVITKNQALANLKAAANLLANKVYSGASVTDAQKTQLGIPPRASHSVVPAPQTSPALTVKAVSGWTVTIQLKAVGSDKRGKPAGVAGASVFSYIGATPPADISKWTFQGNCGRTTSIDVVFASSNAPGTQVWLTAFWFNNRKQSGPACSPVSTTLQGGSVSLRDAA